MDDSTLQQLINDAIFLTPRQQQALVAVVPRLSPEQCEQLGHLLTKTTENLTHMAVAQNEKRDAMAQQFAAEFEKIGRQEKHNIFQSAEASDRGKEAASLDTLLNQL